MSNAIRVVSQDGLHGTIDEAIGSSKQVEVKLDDGRSVLVSPETLILQADGSYSLAASLEKKAPSDAVQESGEKVVLPVVEEVLKVEKNLRTTGRVRIDKVVHEKEQVVDEPLLREQVEIERTAVNQVLEHPAQIRYEGETMVVPIMEEVLVVEKRLMLKEEVRITVRRTTVNSPQSVTLRSEEAVVRRLEPKDK